MQTQPAIWVNFLHCQPSYSNNNNEANSFTENPWCLVYDSKNLACYYRELTFLDQSWEGQARCQGHDE